MRKLLLLLGLCFIAFAVMAVFFVPAAWLRFPLPGTPTLKIEIPEGANTEAVANLLVQKKILTSPRGYLIYSYLDSAARRPKAGTYDVKFGTSYKQLARTFAIGPIREEMSITVIEGWTIYDIEMALKEKGIDVHPSDFLADRFAAEFPFLKDLPPNATLEGYLFPDTYRVWRDQLPDALLRKQLQEFSVKTAGFAEIAKKEGHTLHEILIFASMVEKEAQHDEDRPIIAGIFMNRLHAGMAMQSDATLNYVTHSGRSRLTLEETNIDSPYNTYKYVGFPPGPISNPGKPSLDATLHHAHTNYFYFLTDADGKAYFGRTLDEHVQNRIKAFGN